MRGLFSFIFVLAMVLPFAILMNSFNGAERQLQNSKELLARLQDGQESELEIKNAFSQVLAHSPNDADGAAINLAILEKKLEAKYAQRGSDLDLWFGAESESEFAVLRNDFDRMTLDYEKTPHLLVSAFVFQENGRMTVSKKGLVKLPEAVSLYAATEIVFAADLESDGTKKLILMAEGFG